jgi:hypothetical protein
MTSLLDAPPAGALLGDQRPRICTGPPFASSAGLEAVELAERAGLVLDSWQRFALARGLGEQADGHWAAFEVGLVVGRQNGKGSVLEARELAGLYLFGEDLILHSAHEFKTAQEAFRRVLALIENTDELRRRVMRVRTSHGEEGVELKTGQRLRFIARSRTSGRGFSGDTVILDEAFELPEPAMSALLPTMSARPNPQLWYTSSAADRKHHHDCRVLSRVRVRGMSGKTRRLCYMEWSVDAEDLDDGQREALRRDRRAWARANPGLGIRISEEFVEGELGALGPKGFDVERLGIGDWPENDEGKWAVLSQAAWSALADPSSEITGPVAFAAALNDERTQGAIAAAGRRADGLWHVEVLACEAGSGWMAERLLELDGKWRNCGVVVAGGGPEASLIAPLTEAGFEVVAPTADPPESQKALVRLNSREAAAAFGGFFEAVVDTRSLRHLGQHELDLSVALGQTRDAGDAKTWDRRAWSESAPVVAATNALWLFATRGHLVGQIVLDGPIGV